MDNPKNLDKNFISSPESLSVPDQANNLEAGPTRAVFERAKTAPAQAPVVVPDLDNISLPLTQQTVVLKQVENILVKDMDKIFLSMDVATQAIFKARGEQTAAAITALLQKTKIQIKKIIFLIIDWLRIVPNINKFYLEQEAKLKAEEIVRLHKNQ